MRQQRRLIIAALSLAGGGGDQPEPNWQRGKGGFGESQSQRLTGPFRGQNYREEVQRLRDQAKVPDGSEPRRDLQELARWYEGLAEAAEKWEQRRRDAGSLSRSKRMSPPTGETERRRFSR